MLCEAGELGGFVRGTGSMTSKVAILLTVSVFAADRTTKVAVVDFEAAFEVAPLPPRQLFRDREWLPLR
jgi:hypothetical protein